MGIEYKIQFTHPSPESIATVLRQLPMALEVSAGAGKFELRAELTKGAVPDATAHVESDGLYFCDNGGAGKQFLGVIVARLVSEFGPVTVTDWE